MHKEDKKRIKRIAVFDFDGTLIDTPLDKTGKDIYEQKTGSAWPHKGWWSKPESLDMDIFEMLEIKETIEAYEKESSDSETLLVMMTGRIQRLSKEVEKILDAKGLKFDRRIYNMGGSTLESKITSLNQLLIEYPDVTSIVMWDDRISHIPEFQKWGDIQTHIDFDITHIKGIHHEPQ